eukprot:Skav202062  [mRNA]  locus=scaffold1138:593531:596650:- [translate_table: standard]
MWEMTEAVADALQRAEMRLLERAELGVAGESSLGALGSMAASMAEDGELRRSSDPRDGTEMALEIRQGRGFLWISDALRSGATAPSSIVIIVGILNEEVYHGVPENTAYQEARAFMQRCFWMLLAQDVLQRRIGSIMGIQVCLTSGEEIVQAERGQTLRELHCKVSPGPTSTVPTFLRADGRVLTEDDVVDEPLTLVWLEWWHNFNIRKQSPNSFQKFFPRDDNFNVAVLEMALLAELGENIDYERALQADIEITVLNVLHHFRPESPLLRSVKDFTAFAVAYLPAELASVLNVLLSAAMEDMSDIKAEDMSSLKALRRFGFGENFTATLGLVEETVKHLLKSLEPQMEELIPVIFKSDLPRTINVRKAWREEAYKYFRNLRPKLLNFLQRRDQLAFAGRAHEIDGWLNLHRPFSHEPDHYQRDPRFSGFWAL